MKDPGRTYCLQCGKKIAGRTDKVFCSDRCRSLYNYHKSRNRVLVRARIMNALEKNYSLLDALIRLGVHEAEVGELELMGFKTGCATHFTERGKLREYWCFDIRYDISGGRLFNLRRPLELMKDMP